MDKDKTNVRHILEVMVDIYVLIAKLMMWIPIFVITVIVGFIGYI